MAAFGLLYGPLASLHELAGRALLGDAWHARRRALYDRGPSGGNCLDVGCGEGRLLADIAATSTLAVGADPSSAATRRARRRLTTVVQAKAQALPFRAGVFDIVVCTYPGPWISDVRVWDEVARVTRPGATIAVLLGGDYVRGPLARLRMVLARLAYGRAGNNPAVGQSDLPLGNDAIQGAIIRQPDAWGTAIVWIGTRAKSGSLL